MSIYGFQTSFGSLYILDGKGRTIRFKVPAGKGCRQWHALSHCLYVPGGVEFVQEIYDHLTERIELCAAVAGSPWGIRLHSGSPRPDGLLSVAVNVINRKTYKTRTIKAELNPQIGLTPVEKAHCADGSRLTHIGHPITRVFDNADELARLLDRAGAPR